MAIGSFLGKSFIRGSAVKTRLGIHKKIQSGFSKGFQDSTATTKFTLGSVSAGAILARANAGASKISQIPGKATDQIYQETLRIIKSAYSYEYFYRASWKKKSRMLAKSINDSQKIPNPQSTVALADLIYMILKESRNRLGNEKLANTIMNRANFESSMGSEDLGTPLF